MIDTHAHLDSPDYKEDFSAVLKRAAACGVRAIVCVAVSYTHLGGYPFMDKGKTFYITTPIYYPSDKLHIGHSYTCLLYTSRCV